MKNLREFVIWFLVIASIITVPLGMIALFGGLNGLLADAEYRINVTAGLTLFSMGLVPLAALLILVRFWYPQWPSENKDEPARS